MDGKHKMNVRLMEEDMSKILLYKFRICIAWNRDCDKGRKEQQAIAMWC